MTPSVKSVYPKNNYHLEVHFDNGEYGTLDMQPYLNFGIFNRIKDINAFNRVNVAFDTIEWQVGVDLDPEFVYQKTDKI